VELNGKKWVIVTAAIATNRREWGSRPGYDQQENWIKQANKVDVNRVTERDRGILEKGNARDDEWMDQQRGGDGIYMRPEETERNKSAS